MSVVSYCSTVYNGTTNLNIQKIQKIQNFASKVALGYGKKYDHATAGINKLGWLKVENKIVYDICVFVYKVIHDQLPPGILTLETVNHVRSRYTRQSSHLVVPRTRTVKADRSVSVRGPKFWNTLPEDIKECNNFSCFKKKLKSYLFIKQ